MDMMRTKYIRTVLQSTMRLFKILNASITIIPATMAFVVAIAGIILPAIATQL